MQAWGLFSYVTGKAAVGYLILRVMGNRFVWQKWTIWAAIILTFLLNSVNIILTFAQCDPPRALWEKNVPAKCWDPKVQSDYAFFVAGKQTLLSTPKSRTMSDEGAMQPRIFSSTSSWPSFLSPSYGNST